MSATGRLSETQRGVAAELVSIDTGINCYEEAVLILDTLTALVAGGESSVTILRWLSLLPRATEAARERMRELAEPRPTTQLTMLTPLAGKRDRHMPMADALRDPDAPKHKPGPRVEREARRRKPTGVCVDCGETFAMNPIGRPATRCPTHKGKPMQQQASA